MPDNVDKLFEIMQAKGAASDRGKFRKVFLTPGNKGYKIRKDIYDGLRADGIIDSPTYEDFRRKLRLGGTPTVNKYRQQMFNSVDPHKSRASELTRRAVGQAVRATNNVRKPVTAKVVNQKGKPTGEEFAITPAKTVEDLDREYAQETTKNWENELHDQIADADKDAAKISDMFKSFIGSTDEVGSVWGNMTRGGGIAGTPHSVTTNNGILENTETRQILAAGDYNRKRRELLQLEQDSRNGAIFDNHSFFRGMYDAAKDTGFLTGGASDLINAGSLLATKQDLDNGIHTEAGDMLMQQAVKNSNAQSQYGDNQGWMYTGGVITTNMAPFMVQIGSAGFSKGMSNAIGKVVQGAASKVALGTMEKATGMVGAHIANYIGKVTGLTTKAFGKAIQYGIVGAAQANTVGLGNVANDVINRYTGQVYQDEQGNYKFGTFDSDGKLVHEGGEDFLTALVKGEAAQTIEFATELAGGGIDAAGTALKNFVTKGGKKIINKYNMENVSKVIDFLLNNKVSKNARYLKAGADRTLGKVEVNSIVGESLEEELGIIANTVFTGDNKISDLWDEKQQSQIWGGMLLSIGLMKGAVAPFHAYNAKQYYSYKHKLDKADVNLSQLLGKDKWEELRNQIDATTNDDMPEMVNKINRDVALGKNRQPVREYIQNLLIMRGYDIGNMLAAKKAVEDKGEGVSVKNMEKNQAYQQGRDAYGYDTHEIQLDQEDKQKSLAQLLGISEQQLASMSDEELEALSGRDDNIDRAIYDYQLSTARYEGVIDNARDQIDLEVQKVAQAVDMYTDKSRNTIRNATIKATGGLEDYGVYIINGNIATHEDGSIDISNSDDMILYYDPTTNTVEHADAMMFAELGSEENADEVRSQAMADAKEKAIKETTGIIDGVVEVGTQFKTVDADGTEHTYEVLADNGDGTAMITIDGNIPTELVKGENVNVPVSFEELQKMKDASDQQRLQEAKAQREQMEKERAEQQTQQTEETQPSFDFNQILNDNGSVVLVDVLDKDGNTRYPDSRLFLIRDAGAKAKVVELKSDGTIVPHAVNKEDVATISSMSLDEYKQAFAESSMIEDNSGENRGEIEAEPTTIEGETAGSAEETAAPEATETPETEQTPAAPAITLEDGTIVPMLEDGNPDFSKLTAAQTAELYDNQFGEDADSVISSWVSDAKKALDKANNMTVKGKTFVEQKAAKDAKEKAIADAQAAYDSAIAIRDAYNERQLAKVEDTAEGRKNLIEKARRKFARLKSSVKDDAEAVAQIYKETVGSLLHRLYDGTGIDVTDTIPLTAEEYVASNLGAHSLNYEGTETSKSVKQETGLSREDFAKTQLLAADGKGTTIDNLVHSLWENRPSNLDSLDTQDIRNAMLSIITSGFKASEARNYIENLRIAQAENILEEQKKAADNAAFAEEQKAESESQTETAPESEEKTGEEKSDEENEKINEQTNENINAPEQNKFPDKLREGSKAIEVPEDATDENPLGLQLSKDKVPFEIEGGKSGETYNINDNEDRQRLINDNKVDDKDILDIDMPKHVHKAIKELCKKMGLKVQFLYMGARSNGWIENGTMYLALDTEMATQFVFGHEMTHAIKQKNPEAYKELVKVAMAVTTRKKFEEDLAKVYQNYYGISGYNNVDDYVEEVVADNLGKFINDFDLAQKFSLRLNHPVLATILHAIQKIKSLLYGDFYKSVDALERIVEKAYVKTANGQVTNSETGEDVSFSLRQKPEPKKKGVGYKVFVLKDGKLYPPMVANPDGAATPVGVWLDADAAPIAGESKTGRPQVKQGGKGTQGGSGKLAYRPGWHLGVVPYAIQFNRKDAEGNKTLFPKNFVFAEVEYAADVDYQEEARQEGINPSGKYQHSLAGLKHLPTDGYYMYRTNPNPETDPWVITGAMKVNRILTRAEQADLVSKAGREPQQIQEGDIVTDDVVNSINQEIADAPKFSLKVYHGSGADFTEFDFDHMGEGAGSQAFGWGGYVTSSKKIGKDYAAVGQQSAESRHAYSEDTPIEAAVSAILGQDMYNNQAKTFEQKKAQAIKNAENSIVNFSNMLNNSNELDEKGKKFLKESIEKDKKKLEVLRTLTEEQYKEEYIKQGRAKNLYEVDIPEDNGSNYLKWYETLNEEQINTIRDALAKKGVDVSSWENRGFKLDLPFKDVYAAVLPMMMRCEPKEVSKFLSSIGYTGIKYPAGTIMGGAEEDDTNYVIFKPEDMKITQHTKFSLRLKSAIEDTETNPSDAQKESGNYKKGHIKFGGYDYTIENPKGSTRSGKDADGKEWKVIMHDTYGYIRGKFGKDGDHLDMFINDKADLDNWDGDVFVVDQVNPDGSFDEHKVMYGYDSMDDAEKAYLANYSKGWKGLGNITGASKAEFDKWLDTSNRKLKPFADYAKVKFSQAQSVSEPRYSFNDIKPVGVGAFGNIYNQFRGKSKAAIEFLKKLGSGEATAALHHHTIGDISLVWGDKKAGLDKILRKHPEVVDNLQSIIDSMEVVQESDNRIKLESPTHFAVVSKEYKGEPREQWLLTAYEKRESLENDKSMDTATSSLGGDTALSQSKGSAAKIDNSSETSKENGEKFSLKDEKTMFGMHNISLDKLRRAIKQGGFAAPSMGVIDSKNGIYSGYGEITLIPKAEKIAKRTGKNIGTYAADAWTPIYPPVEKKFGGNGGDVAYDDIESVPKEMQRLTRNAINSFMDGREANGLAYLYLQEKGKAPELVHVEGKYPKELHDEVKGILGKLNGIYNTTDEQKEKLLDLFIREVYDGNKEEFDNDIKKFIKKDEEFIKKRPNSNIAKNKQLDVDWMKEHGYDYGALSRFVDGILRDAETSGKVDENATMKAAQQYIQDKGMKEDFDSWKEKLNDRYNVEEVIFAGYKPDGNRKYLPNTVENAVKVMKQDGKNASVGSASFSHFVASILKPMGTLDQIRKKKGNLTGNYEDVEKFQEKWQPVYDELADKMQPDAEPFESYGMDRLEEVATQKNPKKYAKEEYGVDLTDEDINKLNELIEAVKNDKPSVYFETKFMRPYGLDEFEKAIVPNDTPSDVVDALKMAGIDVSSYERGNAEDRQKVTMDAINSSDNIRFSLKEEKEKIVADMAEDLKSLNTPDEVDDAIKTAIDDMPSGWKMANKKMIHIAQALGENRKAEIAGEEPKFSLKDGSLIKAGGNTRFSLRYDQFEHDLNQWKKDNNLPKDAQRPTIPQRNAGESAVDFLRRVDEYRKQMALWKTAPTYEQHLLSDDTALGEFNRELQKGSVLKRIAFQDSMLAIRKAQEAIMKEVGVDRLNMAEDAYTAENRSHGKGKNEFEEYNNEFLQPLRKAYHQMKKVLGDSYDNVRIYMMAKHGLERDAQMAFKKSLEADYEDVAQRSAAYKAYKGDMNRIINDSDLEFGRVDFTTWRQRDNALRVKYSPSYMNYRYDKMGIAYDYSGLSALFDGSDFEEAAHKLIKDIESKYVTETHNLWDATNAATKKILRDGYKAGMMSKDTYQYVRDMYSHYIPLRGWDGTTADQVWDYIGGGKGAFNQTLKKAHGRTSIADDPIAYIENMAESGILLNNKNWVKQHLMLLAQNHPTSLLTLSKAWYVKSVDDNGNEEWIPATPQITSQMDSNQVKAAIDAFEKKMEQMAQTGDATQKRDGLNIAYPQTHSEEREHEVRVMKDGEEYVIYVNGDPQLAQAMNNTRAHRVREIQSGKLDRAAAWLGRKMAAAYTSLSPLFIPSNYFRDLTMTLASTAIREDAKYNYLLRKNLATSWNLGFMLRDYQSGKLREKVSKGNATPKEQMFYDFMMNGGETGFVSSLDVEDLKKKFKNDLKDLDRWKTNPVKVGHTIMDGIEFLNRAIEDSNRFAVYMTSIQYGRSIDEAVNDAKDVTLNFNRKGTGEYGWQMIRNLYLFINPAVQSLQTLGALVKHHPFKFTAVTASWLASGVLVPIVNAALMSMLGGDDDKDKYWQFTKWDRRNNLIMWVPFTHEYVKIPLAQEFRAFYGVGDMIASKMMGGELAEESWSQYGEDLLGQVVDMLPLDPTGYDGNIAVSLMPNAIRPVFELAFNVDFTGKPLFKETEYNKYDPNFTKAYVGTPDWLVRASKMVNSIGNDYPDVQQNSIDAFGDPKYNLNNPAVVDHVLSSYLGGAYTMGSQVLGVLTKSLNDPKEIKVADIPLFSKFVSNPDDRPVTKKQGDEFWNMKENHDRAANTLSKLKKQAKVDGDYSMLERFYGSDEYKQYKQDDVKVKKYEEDKKKERAEESGEEYRPHKLNAEDIYKAHATPKDDFEDLKLKQLYTKLNGFKSAYDLLVDTAPSQSDGYYNTNKAAIDAIDEISLDKQEISELKKGFLDDGKDAYNAEDMKQIRELRKKILAVLEKANKVVVANQKAKAKKK